MIRRATVLGALLSLAAGCCDSSFGEPDDGAQPPPRTETIAALRALYAGETFPVTGDITVEGTVTSSDRARNFYRSLCIEDGNAAIEVMAGIDQLHNAAAYCKPDGCPTPEAAMRRITSDRSPRSTPR